uniref:Rac GTPase-activating protein 1 n=1 Tax=Timema monikensis TaxID=170555 RepID=A0A7R9HQ65_9NEOP|nr:unnamed protein product [Timema monikensis]
MPPWSTKTKPYPGESNIFLASPGGVGEVIWVFCPTEHWICRFLPVTSKDVQVRANLDFSANFSPNIQLLVGQQLNHACILSISPRRHTMTTTNGNAPHFFLTPAYKDLARRTSVLTNSCEQEFLRFAINQEECRQHWLQSVREVDKLKQALEKSQSDVSALESRLRVARRYLDDEKKRRRLIESERESLEKQLELVRDVVLHGNAKFLNEETKEKLAFLNNTSVRSRRSNGADGNSRYETGGQRLDTISEGMDSTVSILSDLSYSRSEDDLDLSLLRAGKQWRRYRHSNNKDDSPSVKRAKRAGNKSIELEAGAGERVVATTTVTMNSGGPIKASSKLETILPQQSRMEEDAPFTHFLPSAPFQGSTESVVSSMFTGSVQNYPQHDYLQNQPEMSPKTDLMSMAIKNKIHSRPHVFVTKTTIRPETCGPCNRRIKFGKVALRCQDCRTSCHNECKDKVPLPCVPLGNTPNKKGGMVSTSLLFISRTLLMSLAASTPPHSSLVTRCLYSSTLLVGHSLPLLLHTPRWSLAASPPPHSSLVTRCLYSSSLLIGHSLPLLLLTPHWSLVASTPPHSSLVTRCLYSSSLLIGHSLPLLLLTPHWSLVASTPPHSSLVTRCLYSSSLLIGHSLPLLLLTPHWSLVASTPPHSSLVTRCLYSSSLLIGHSLPLLLLTPHWSLVASTPPHSSLVTRCLYSSSLLIGHSLPLLLLTPHWSLVASTPPHSSLVTRCLYSSSLLIGHSLPLLLLTSHWSLTASPPHSSLYSLQTSGVIGDYAPTMSPMIPSILVHCIQEVELRGLKEVGIYRISTSDREVKALKEKFLRGKGVPNLSSLDIHTICGTIKDFLRFLREPLVTYLLWPDFVRASEMASQEDGKAAIYQAIAELPQPNRDTLAFVILHLQRVMESPEVKMPIDNIAKVFGPTLVGYSSNDPTPITILNETKKQTAVMQFLLRIPEDYWMRFTNSGGINQAASELRHTPSSITLTRNGSNTSTYRGIFNTPLGSSRNHPWQIRKLVILLKIRFPRRLKLTREPDLGLAILTRDIAVSQAILTRDIAVSQAILTRDIAVSQTIPTRDIAVSQALPTRDIAVSQAIPTRDIAVSQTIPTRDIAVSRTIPTRDIAVSRTIPTRHIAVSRTIPTRHIAVSQTIPTREIAASQAIPTREIAASQALPTRDIAVSQAIPTREIAASQAIPTRNIAVSQAIPTREIAASQAIPTREIAASQALPTRHIAVSQAILTRDIKSLSQFFAAWTRVCTCVGLELLGFEDPLSPCGGFGAKFCGRGSGDGSLVPGLGTVNHGPHQRYSFTGCIPGASDQRHSRVADQLDTPEVPREVYGYAQDSQRQLSAILARDIAASLAILVRDIAASLAILVRDIAASLAILVRDIAASLAILVRDIAASLAILVRDIAVS